MYLEASLFLSFDKPTRLVRVPAPTVAGRVLQVLSLGMVGDEWEREAIEPAGLVRRLSLALRDAGITDLVSVAVDDREVFRDDNDRDNDLEPALAQLRRDAEAAGPDHAACLEAVATVRDERGTFVIQIIVRRVHPLDTPPIQVRIYAVMAEFDLRHDGGGYRSDARSAEEKLQARMLERMHQAKTHQTLLLPLYERLEAVAVRLEQALREHLKTHATEAIVLGCVVRPRDPLPFSEVHMRGDGQDAALFRPHPGFREATYHLRLWSTVLTLLGASIQRTLIVDERGRPVLHIADEPLDLQRNNALRPGAEITRIRGLADLVYFAGNAYEEELRAAHCITPSEEVDADAAWKVIRHRELGVKHTKAPEGRRSLSEFMPGLTFSVVTGRSGETSMLSLGD